MKNNSGEILANVLAMDEEQLATFMTTLSLDNLDYLDVLLAKAEKNSPGFKKYLDSQ